MRYLPVTFLSITSLFGQQTYNLQGAGYVQDMRYLQVTSITMTVEQGGQSQTGTYTYTQTVKVDEVENGKIVKATVRLGRDCSTLPEEMAIPEFFVERDLAYSRKWNGWSVSAGSDPLTKTTREALERLAFCDETETLPGAPVSVGYKWSVPVSSLANQMASADRSMAEVYRNASGQMKYVFDSLTKVDNEECAVIKGDMNIKLSIPNQGSYTMKSTSREIRQTSNGFRVFSEAKAEGKGSGFGMVMTSQINCKLLSN